MSDLFDKYLKDEYEHKQQALTSSSYKNTKHNNSSEQNDNSKLGTYGDALLKLALCKILYDENVEKITEKKQEYESDKILVTVVAKKYNLLKYIHFDENDKNIPQNYDYTQKSDKSSPHKYIATAVEALLAAFYLDNKEDFNSIVEVVTNWKKWIDEQNVSK